MLAARYEGIAHRQLEFGAPVEPEVARSWLAEIGAPPTVIDLGCGTGSWLRAVVREAGQRGWGVDRAREVLDVAAASPTAGGTVRWIEADAARWLRDSGARADLVICVGVEHFAGAWRDSIALAAAAVAPGGRLLLGTSVRRPHPVWDALPALAAQIPTPAQLAEAVGDFTVARQRAFGREAFERYDRACRAAVDAHLSATPDEPEAAALRHRNEKGRLFFEQVGFDALAFELQLLAR